MDEKPRRRWFPVYGIVAGFILGNLLAPGDNFGPGWATTVAASSAIGLFVGLMSG